MVEEVKRSSSKWIKSLGPSYHDFSWQEGYGAFSVSQSKVETVTRYILGQKEHHKKMTFQDELKMFLKEYQVEYNEEFIYNHTMKDVNVQAVPPFQGLC